MAIQIDVSGTAYTNLSSYGVLPLNTFNYILKNLRDSGKL